MRALVTAAEMRAAEAEAASRGLSTVGLMQLAGRGAAAALLARPDAARRRYLVLVGPGNNGGDALVVAGLLNRAGAAVRIISYHRPLASGGNNPAPNPPALPGASTEVLTRFDLANDPDGSRLREALLWCDTLVDGILGTGLSRPPEPELVAILKAIQGGPRRPHIVALDVPTGVDADSGAAEVALVADQTLTFGYLKRGLLLYPARARCGEICVVDIGLPEPPAIQVAAWEPDHRDVAAWLPSRRPTVQKYSAGAVLALAGSPHYVGAPVLACTAAMRSGAGYVTLATTNDAMPVIAPRLLETTLAPLPSHGDEGPGPDALSQLQSIAGRYSALLVGPGLGRAALVAELVQQVLGGSLTGPRAAVVDADALYALSTIPNWEKRLAIPIVLTPHAGEMARLTGLEARQVEADRYGVAAAWSRRWGQVLVLKGAPTVVASPSGVLSVNPTGNPLLATAGTGDVLSGVIAALLAGGADPYDAARAGVYIHGLAADLAVPDYGDRGMVAGDLLPLLPAAIKAVLKGT